MVVDSHHSKQLSDVIVSIARSLTGITENWAITGGANLCAYNCIPSARDIDIITTKSGAHIISSILLKEEKPLPRTFYNNISSHYSTGIYEGFRIEIMGDPHNLIDDYWVPNRVWESCIDKLTVDNVTTHRASIHYEFYIYSLLQNDRIASAIRKTISLTGTQGINTELS